MASSSALTLWLILALLIAVYWLWSRSRSLSQESGMPDGDVIYADGGTWFRNNETLISKDFRLSGRPDYLVEQSNGSVIPVELKSSLSPQEPQESHVLQLAAYCLLVEESYGVRPEYGILQYQDKAFAIDYSEDLEENLLDLLAEMREASFARELNRDHNQPAKCRSCGVRRSCHQRLA